MELFKHTPKFDFLGKSKFFIFVSLILIFYTVYLWVVQGEQKYGTDFSGGYEFIIKLDAGASEDQLRAAARQDNLPITSIQSFGLSGGEFSVRFTGSGTDVVTSEQTQRSLQNSLSQMLAKLGAFEIVRTDFVGPVVGKELRRNASIAVVLGLVGILLYLTVRFQFAFAFGAVVALFHDVVVSLGAYLFFEFPINMGTLAAALTIVGYSVNDTIVIFDRVRENLSRLAQDNRFNAKQIHEIVNLSLNECLGRTLITQGLTMLSVIALLAWGGGAIADLSLYLFAGMVAGTYSTIYIASPAMIWWFKRS